MTENYVSQQDTMKKSCMDKYNRVNMVRNIENMSEKR